MNKLLLTFGVGEHVELLDLSRPFMEAYAVKHGYDYGEVSPKLVKQYAHGRQTAWAKLPAIASIFENEDYNVVLWIDCDVLIRRDDKDILDDFDSFDWQGMVLHHTPDGEVPGTGVWMCKREMGDYLSEAWSLYPDMESDPWWEQAAIMRLMGYDLKRPTKLVNPTELYHYTSFIDSTWNNHPWDCNRVGNPRFQHFTPGPVAVRVAAMKKAIEEM